VNAVPAVQSAATGYILLIEDDAGVRDVLTDILRDEGYAVAAAKNGREALGYLESNPAPRLIMLDLMMPVMDGQAFRAEQLKIPTFAVIPTVVLSAARNGKETAEALGAQGYLQKPIDLEALLAVIVQHP
jgi:CheY-like chemotaxis protein